MARMLRGRIVAVLLVTAAPLVVRASTPAGKPDRIPPVPPQELFVLVKQATILSGTGIHAFTGDIGISASRRVRTVDGRRQIQIRANIADLGDLRTYGALRTIDGSGLIAAPLWDVSLKEGQEVDLPDWSRQPSARTIAPGQPAEIVLMRPLGDPSRSASRHVIQTILKY
jgi:hypothetical protein